MANSVINTLSLCSGYAGLDLGLEAACDYLGLESRTVAYVEWEAYAAALLVARMEAGHLAAAPVWCGDLGQLDGADFRGAVDCVTAGFPCQPHSQAGARKGINDERWIWPDIARIVRESGAWLVVLENVPGLLSSGGFGPVLGDLAEMGFDAEWAVLSAAAVGASHRRERVFVVGYSRLQQQYIQQRDDGAEHQATSGDMAYACGAHREGGGNAVTRPDGRSRMDMLDWKAESFLPQAQTQPDGEKSSPNTHSSLRRLNPAFVCWLMGIPWWWTNIERTNYGSAAMESYRSKLARRLRCLLGD